MELAKETLTQRIANWERENAPQAIREEYAFEAARELIAAMSELNAKDICHRDIKPDNIFITEAGVYKIADFDISRKIERNDGVTRVQKLELAGTDLYMAPELRDLTHNVGDSEKTNFNLCDVYSLGLTILRIVTKREFASWNTN